jgi:small subunit ribosomal protein S6
VHDYEVTFILNPTLGEDEVTANTERITALIANAGGEVIDVHSWGGKRRLAYPIQHQREGYYVTTKFHTSPAAAHGLDAQIKLNDNVIRHLVIRLDPSKT